VAIADLDEAEFALCFMAAHLRQPAQAIGLEHSSFDHTKRPGTGPGHALQKSSAVNAIPVMIVQDFIFEFVSHFFLLKESRASMLKAFAMPSFCLTVSLWKYSRKSQITFGGQDHSSVNLRCGAQEL